MTIERMIELLKIEHECMLRGAHDDCDRKCADCELVQDDGELHEMYTNVIRLLKEQEATMQCIKGKCRICPHCANCDVDENGLLKEQEAVEPTWQQGKAYCGACGKRIPLKIKSKFCHKCGKPILWKGRRWVDVSILEMPTDS